MPRFDKISRIIATAGDGALPPCPSCGGPLMLTEATVSESFHPGYHVADQPLPRRERDVLAVACSGCEFITEVRI